MLAYSFLRRHAWGTVLILSLIAGGTPAVADLSTPAADSRIVAARVFMEEARPDLACALLEYSHGADTREPEALYILALCSRDLGQLDESIGYYERLVLMLPEASKPRAELAALYARAGRAAEAQLLYQQAAQLQPGTAGAALFSRLASAVISDDPAQIRTPAKRWEATLGISAIHDDNVNAGPTATTTAGVIGGVPVQLDLDPGMRPRSSWGTMLSAGGRYLVPISGRWAVLYQGDLSGTRYFSERDFDAESAALGAAFVRRSATGTLSIQPNARYVRRDNALQEATHGLSLNLGRQFSQTVQLGGALGYFHRRVPVSDAHDADGYTTSISVQKTLDTRIQLGGQYLYQYEDAQLASQTRTMHGPSVFATYTVGNSIQLLMNYRYVVIDYDERQPLFSDAREDEQHQVSLGARLSLRQWVGQNIELNARYSYTDNSSNLAHYDHDRNLATVGLLARF